MTIDPREAAASLDDIARIERRTHEALYYAGSSTILFLWAAVWFVGHILTFATPRNAALIWGTLDAIGVCGAVVIGYRRSRARRRDWDWRISIAFAVLMGFGFLWQWLLGSTQWREIAAFWPTLFMFGYIIAGLWIGRFFIVCGAAVTVLVLAGYLWTGPWFDLWMAVVGGGALALGGLWLRRTGAPV